MKTTFLILLAVLIGAFAVNSFLNSKNQQYKYVITETVGPASFDPLDGDQSHNLPVQRMIYATPLEVDQKGTLKSIVLESFNFDPNNNLMTWVVKNDQKFSDGSIITADDVAFAVARMAYKRPHFPVIENIEGVQEWSKDSNALETYPSGIKVTGNKIEIQFSKSVDHPLFRFCLEIFSIIPKKCVDLKTNSIHCDPLPISGHYEIVKKSENEIQFKIRGASYLKDAVPEQITFEYLSPKSVFNGNYKPTGITVIQGNEFKLTFAELDFLNKNFKTDYLPSARIVMNLLNPNTGAFKNKNCRLLFADYYRKAFSSLAINGFKVESSLFTEVLPGYMSSSELNKAGFDKISDGEKKECLLQLKQDPPRWAVNDDVSFYLFNIIIEKTYDLLGITHPEPLKLKDRKEEVDAFIDGKISILGTSTGFWALDPAGDIQMLLTPNMHKLLEFVSNDNETQSLIRKLKSGNENTPEAFKNLNQYIYNDGKFNVFAHVRRFYASDSLSNISELPVSITSPAPYQVFRMK